jgi:hypothetical protein
MAEKIYSYTVKSAHPLRWDTGVHAGVDFVAFRFGRDAATSAKAPIFQCSASVPMQACDSLRVSSACEMV